MGRVTNKVKKKTKKNKAPGSPSGVCLVAAVGLTQDLKLMLSTKKHQTKQNKENKTQARIHLLQQKVEKDSL